MVCVFSVHWTAGNAILRDMLTLVILMHKERERKRGSPVSFKLH